MTFGEKIKELRAALGWSQSITAKNLGIPVGTLRNWEQNRKKPTNFVENATIYALQNYLSSIK